MNENGKSERLKIRAAFLDEITADIPALNYDREDWDAEFAEMKKAGITRGDIDAVAVTYAPGLIGAVLVGVNFAKAAAMGDEQAAVNLLIVENNRNRE